MTEKRQTTQSHQAFLKATNVDTNTERDSEQTDRVKEGKKQMKNPER